MSDNDVSIHEITLSEEMLFPDAQSLTDVAERPSAGGFILRATRTGNTVRYSATDGDGMVLQGKYLRMTDGAPPSFALRDMLLLRLGNRPLDQPILHPLAPCQQGQSLAGDVGLEVLTLLVRLEGGLVAEQFVEQELGRVVLGAGDQEKLGAGLLLCLGKEA
jgi:hypothetical protein